MGRVFTREPTEEMMLKIRKARATIVSSEQRNIKCPYCEHTALVVYAGTTGHVKTKCVKCKHEVIIDLVNMRNINHN